MYYSVEGRDRGRKGDEALNQSIFMEPTLIPRDHLSLEMLTNEDSKLALLF